MGLKDLYNQLELLTEQSKQFATSGENLRKQAAIQELAQVAPELINQGDWATVASKALEAGDPTMLRTLLATGYKAQVAPKAAGTGVLTPEKASFLEKQGGLEPGSLAAFVGDKVTAATAAVSAGQKQQSLGLQAGAQARLGREEVQKQRKNVSEIFGPLEKNLAEERRAMEKVDQAFASNSLPGDAIVFNFIARNLAGEKGPLSEGDIVRIIGRSFQGDLTAAQNYMQSIANPKASPEQRARYRELLDIAKKNYGTYKNEAIQKAFAQAVEDNPKLFEGGKLDPQIAGKAARLNVDVKKGGNGQIEVIFKESKKVIQPGGGGQEANNAAALTTLATKIPDPKKRQQALDAIASYNGKVMDEATTQRFKDLITQLSR